MRQRSVKLLVVMSVATGLICCNSQNIKPQKDSAKNTNYNNYPYPAPSENAAEVTVEEVAINSKQSSDDETTWEKASGQMKQSRSAKTSRSSGSTKTNKRSEERSDSNLAELNSHSEIIEDAGNNDFFSNPRNEIGNSQTEEQQEFNTRDRVSGTKSSAFTYNPDKPDENIGPIINIGGETTTAKIPDKQSTYQQKNNRETVADSKDEEAIETQSDLIDGTQLGSSSEDAQLTGWSPGDRKMPLGDEDKAGYQPPPTLMKDIKDDDIVARQLQEAASSEQNVLLREKLWKEYEKYKSGL